MKGLVALCLLLAQPALAETAADRFAPKRGFSTDIWVEWKSLNDLLQTPGFLDVYPDYPRHVAPGTFARLHAQGFDTVRIAADPSPMLALAGTARQGGFLTNLRQRVVEAQAAGLKVILDMHTYPHTGEVGDIDRILTRPADFDAYLQMLSQVAEIIADLDPERTALELMNEPTQDCAAIYSAPATSDWPSKLARLHDVARKAAPDLPLVLSGACWGGAKGLSVLDPKAVHDDNVIWSFHSYDPFTFSHQGANWNDSPLMFVQGLPYPPDGLTDAGAADIVAKAKVRAAVAAGPMAEAGAALTLGAMIDDYRAASGAEMTEAIDAAVVWADANAIPHDRLLLGEFGALWISDTGELLDADSHARFLSDKRRAAEAAGIGWAVWSFSGSFGITDPQSQLYPQVCTALGLMKC